MQDCIFCQIVNGQIAAKKVFEDDSTLAFVCGQGHILVAPKRHVKNLFDCDADTLHRVMDTVKRVSAHLTENDGVDGVNLRNASGESAGQSVPHFYMEIIPRKKGDEPPKIENG